jgi:hypothetical protein
MHNCAFCRNPMSPLAEWKGHDSRFYCSEFCADEGETIKPAAESQQPLPQELAHER